MGVSFKQYKDLLNSFESVHLRFQKLLSLHEEQQLELEKVKEEFKKCNKNFQEYKRIFESLNITFE